MPAQRRSSHQGSGSEGYRIFSLKKDLLRTRKVRTAGMDIEKLQKSVIEFRDAWNWGQFQNKRSEVGDQRSEESQKPIPQSRRDQRRGDQRKEISGRKSKG